MRATEPSLTDRFASSLDALLRAVATCMAARPFDRPLLLLLCSYLRRRMRQFARLVERVRSGAPPPARLPRPAPRPASNAAAPGGARLPSHFGWVALLVPEASDLGNQLQHLLGDPEMAALLAATPQAGRILRPLLRMLGSRPPPELLPSAPKRERPAPSDATAVADEPAFDLPPTPSRGPPCNRRAPPGSFWLGSFLLPKPA